MLMSTIVDGGLYRESTFMLQGLFSPELIANRNRFVLTVGAIMVGVACLSMAMGVLAARCSAIATQGFARNMRSTLLGKIESFSFSNIDHISTPQLITRATTDINTLRDTMRQSLVTLYRAPVMVILATVMSFIVSPGLAPLLLICIPLLVVLMVILLKVGQPRFKRMLKMMDGMNQAVRENLVASRVVKAFVRGGYESKRFDKTTDDLRRAQLGAGRLFNLSGPITMGIMWTCSVLILLLGGRQIIFQTTGLLTGQLVSLVNYAGMAVNSLSMISWLVMSLSRAQASLVRINEVLDEEIDITDGPSDAAVESGSIDFEDVCFSYTRDPDKLALRHVTLHIASGETIGVIGGTGEGKSTLVSLIPRFYDALDGSVGLLKLIPGTRRELLAFMADHYDGLVIEGFGVGGLPEYDGFYDVVRQAAEAGKLIVMTTQVPNEGSDLTVYHVGGHLKHTLQVLEAYDMTTESAVCKLMWILGQTHEPDMVKEMLYSTVNRDILYTTKWKA